MMVEEIPRIRYDERKPWKIGSSLVISLHPDWASKIEEGKPLPVMFNNYYLIIPPDASPDERRELEKFLEELEKKRAERRKKRGG